MCHSDSGIYSCHHFVTTTEHCASCPPEQRVYNRPCSQRNRPIIRDQNFMCDKCDEKENWSMGRSSTDHSPPVLTVFEEGAQFAMPPSPRTSVLLVPFLVETRPMIPRSEALPQQSTSRAAADPNRPRVPRSSTAASNAIIPPRVNPRLMPKLRRTERDISNYSTAINRGETSRSSLSAEPVVNQQSYKCGKHTDFATTSFAVRCCVRARGFWRELMLIVR